ncbi:MAG: hypothetical protein NTV92_00935 [Candidatus Bipolaricaulota bacterium]|nr:hypothetical protein [Candidatus Bipolaricaulota bacterium]
MEFLRLGGLAVCLVGRRISTSKWWDEWHRAAPGQGGVRAAGRPSCLRDSHDASSVPNDWRSGQPIRGRRDGARCAAGAVRPSTKGRPALRQAPRTVTDVFPGNDRSLEEVVERCIRWVVAERGDGRSGTAAITESEVEKVAERTMEARLAERADFGPWLELAAEVEPLFGPMARDPVFQRALSRNIARRTAYCIRESDGVPGSPLVAGLLGAPRIRAGAEPAPGGSPRRHVRT